MLLTKLKITVAGLFLVALVIGAGEEQPPLEKPLQAPPKKPLHEKNVTDKLTDARLAFDQKLAQEKKFVIVGRVMSADGEKPLEGIEVTAFTGYGTLLPAGETKTNRDGKFRLIFITSWFRGGYAVVHARKPGWYAWTYGWPANFYLSDKPPEKANVPHGCTALVPGQPVPLEFWMQPAAALKVKLLDGAGKPLARMRIWLTGENLLPGTNVIDSGSTDAAGGFVATDVPRSSYRLVIEDPAPGRGELELESIHFRDAAEYEVLATVRKWGPRATDISLKVTRVSDR